MIKQEKSASRWSVPCFGNRFFALWRSENSWLSGCKMAARYSKWLPTVLRTDSSHYRHQKMATLWRIFTLWWGISPIGTHWAVFSAFQWAFYFHLTMISFYSDFAGIDYHRQARHHCTFSKDSCKKIRYRSGTIVIYTAICVYLGKIHIWVVEFQP